MKLTEGLKATGNIIQETPLEFFDAVSKVFKFSLDVCALPENAKCERYYSPEDNGLSQKWDGGVWCNPPYGREVINWVKKASEEYMKPYCDFIVMLLPARTDTRWFHDYVYGKARLFFLDGRLRFGEYGSSAPFPSMLALYVKDMNRGTR